MALRNSLQLVHFWTHTDAVVVRLQAVISLERLRDYIAFARTRCHPELTDEAGQDLINAYQQMRRAGVGSNTISATPRQLESMVRLSEALARMRLSPSVERHDVAEAVRLMKVSTVSSVGSLMHVACAVSEWQRIELITHTCR